MSEQVLNRLRGYKQCQQEAHIPLLVLLYQHIPVATVRLPGGVCGEPATGQTSGGTASCPCCVQKKWQGSAEGSGKSLYELLGGREWPAWIHRACKEKLRVRAEGKVWGTVTRVRVFKRCKQGNDGMVWCSPKSMASLEEAGAFQWERVCPSQPCARSQRTRHMEGYIGKDADDITHFRTATLGLCDLMTRVEWVQI